MGHPACKQLLFLPPSSSPLAPWGLNPRTRLLRGRAHDSLRYRRALLSTTPTGHGPGLPLLLSSDLLAIQDLKECLCFPGCLSNFLSLRPLWERHLAVNPWRDLRLFDMFLLRCSSKVLNGNKFFWRTPLWQSCKEYISWFISTGVFQQMPNETSAPWAASCKYE